MVLSESLSIWNCTAMLLHVASWIFGHCVLPLGTLAQWMPFCSECYMSLVDIEILHFGELEGF